MSTLIRRTDKRIKLLVSTLVHVTCILFSDVMNIENFDHVESGGPFLMAKGNQIFLTKVGGSRYSCSESMLA